MVAQIFNLLYRGFAIRKPSAMATVALLSSACRMQFGDTAECNSALPANWPGA